MTWQIPWHSPAGGSQLDLKRFCYMVWLREQTQLPPQNVSPVHLWVWPAAREMSRRAQKLRCHHKPNHTLWKTQSDTLTSHCPSFRRLIRMPTQQWPGMFVRMLLHSQQKTYLSEYLVSRGTLWKSQVLKIRNNKHTTVSPVGSSNVIALG